MSKALVPMLALVFGCGGASTVRAPARPTANFPVPWGAVEPEPPTPEASSDEVDSDPPDRRRYDNADPD